MTRTSSFNNRRAHRWRLTRVAVVALAAAAVAVPLALAAPPEPAAAATWNHRSDYLRFPRPSGGYLRVQNRNLYLTGCYRWRVFQKIWSDSTASDHRRRICLRSGTYR